MEIADDRPKWMIQLENRKRKSRLAHEAGAGSLCLRCKDACPGLDLHFWRKICKICKCSRDDHDVPEDEFPQFNLLLGATPRKKATYLRLPHKEQESEMAFEWIPPNTTTELAADYMKALPAEKLPIQGTSGAALRRQQLQKQLPIHDMDQTVCDELSEQERLQFEKYLENLKRFVGQGRVTKMIGARPYTQSLLTPINATDIQRHQVKSQYPASGPPVNLRTPSSFVPKVPPLPPLEATHNQSFGLAVGMEAVRAHALDSTYDTSRLGQYHHALARNTDNGQVVQSEQVSKGSLHNRPQEFTSSVRSHGRQASPLRTQDIRFAQGAQERSPYQMETLRAGVQIQTDPARRFAQEDIILSNAKSHSHPLEHDDARLAEQMLSEALLPPSAIHSKEIIGSTLDKDKLKFIQQQLSTKYSKDDPVALNLAKSQTVEASNSQHAGTLGRSEDTAIVGPSYAEKEAERAAVIAATGNPSGIYSKEQNVEKMAPTYSSPLGDGGRTRSPDSDANRSNASRESTAVVHGKDGSPSRNPETGNRPYGGNKDRDKYQDSASPSTLQLSTNHPDRSQYLNDPGLHAANINDIQQCHRGDPRAILNTVGHPQAHQLHRHAPASMFGKHSHPTDHPREGDARIYDSAHSQYSGNAVPNSLPADGNSESEITCRNNEGRASPYQLQAELNYQSVPSNVIHSEVLRNPVFPEGVVRPPEVVQNPASVDQLQGAMEQLSVETVQAQQCYQCREGIGVGNVVVTAEKAKNAVWHPGCFVCSICNELLADLVYFYHKGKLYCGRDLATLLEIPRCFACDELIFVRVYTVAEGHNYHVKHFCCWDCDIPLAGQQYISENDHPLCLPCYQKTYAKTCNTCNKVIEADQEGVAVKNLDFHATDTCFRCFTCEKSLLAGKMGIRENKPFCSKDCVTRFFSLRQ